MTRIEGEQVTLYERRPAGVDAFNAPVYEEVPVLVDDVLICPSSSDDIVDAQGMDGRRAVYELCIPKGDAHTWEGCRVDFWGQRWRVSGSSLAYHEHLVPLRWNKRVKVERYE